MNQQLPLKVKCVRPVEIWRPGNTLILTGGMYKSLPGCIFGISVGQVMDAVNSGRMVPVPANEPTNIS